MAMNDPLSDYVSASRCSPGYLDFARVGPLLTPVAEARAHATDAITQRPEQIAELDPAADRAIATAADLLGFSRGNVALSPNTSTGLFQAAFAMPGGADSEVLVSPFDFPANTQAWHRGAQHGGPTLRWMVPETGARPEITPAIVADALTPQTCAVAVSAVDFATGFRVDLSGIRDAIGERLLIVDAIQGFGVVDMRWQDADFIASGGQKWLRAGWSTGILACSERALSMFGPGLSGWSGAKGAHDARSLEPLAPPLDGADRFSITAPDMVAVCGFSAALDALSNVGISMIWARVSELVARTRDGLCSAGATVLGSANDKNWSGIVSFTMPGRPSRAIVERLAAAGLRVSEREGAVRVSIHATTDEATIDALISEVSIAAQREAL